MTILTIEESVALRSIVRTALASSEGTSAADADTLYPVVSREFKRIMFEEQRIIAFYPPEEFKKAIQDIINENRRGS